MSLMFPYALMTKSRSLVQTFVEVDGDKIVGVDET